MEFQPLAQRARLLFHVQALSRLVFFWVPVTVAGALGATFAVSSFTALVGAITWLSFLFMMAIWYPTLAFERWGYLLRDDDLVIQRGVLWRIVTAIPTHRIQHVDTRQGPFEQLLGLARVQIYTASGMGADGIIPGLDLDDAEELRDELVQLLEAEDDGV